MPDEPIAGRVYAASYRTIGRSDIRQYLIHAVERSGGRVLYASPDGRSPLFVGAQTEHDEVLGLMCYAFRCNPPPIKGRSPDEHRVQVRYGRQESWLVDHHVGYDVGQVDVTLILGVHPARDMLLGLDPLLYDPLPMGISVEFKDDQVRSIRESSWHVWERENFAGIKRGAPRARDGLETIVGFTPERLLDYARFDRRAVALGLDPPLRFRAAQALAKRTRQARGTLHALEREFELSAGEILTLVSERCRLKVAVKGGVAERHLERYLKAVPAVAEADAIDEDGEPDFSVRFRSGRRITIECKNVSPKTYADGIPKVEVQKTRASQGDPAGRLYRPSQFDVVAACMFAVTDRWEFRFCPSRDLTLSQEHPGRVAPLQRVDERWSLQLAES
jgi:hypothetical protein